MIHGGSSRFAGSRRGTAAAVALIAGLVAPAAAHADPSVYWSDLTLNTISKADVGGTGGSTVVPTASGAVDGPRGVTFDRSTGKLYWANSSSDITAVPAGQVGSIGVANADGSGASLLNVSGANVDGPSGVAIDPIDHRVYWANTNSSTIGYADLDGSGDGGTLTTSAGTIQSPQGVAIDRASNRIYWTNDPDQTDAPPPPVGYAALDNTGGGGSLIVAGAPDGIGNGVSLDLAGGKAFWSLYGSDLIAYAKLDGSGGGGTFKTTGATVNSPGGTGLDIGQNRVYWTSAGSAQIGYAKLDNSGGGAILNTTGAPIDTAFGSPAVDGAGVATLSSPSHDFGKQALGSTSPAYTQTLTNTGNFALAVSDIVAAGAGATQYKVTDDCPAAVKPKAKCTITTKFAPTVNAAAVANVRVESDAGVVTSGLTGTTGTTVISLDPSVRDMGTIATDVGATPVRSLVLTNNGGGPITVSAVSVKGGDAGDFTIAPGGTCTPGAVVGSGATCTVFVRFDASAIGARSTTLAVESDGGAALAELDGIGSAPGTGFKPGGGAPDVGLPVTTITPVVTPVVPVVPVAPVVTPPPVVVPPLLSAATASPKCITPGTRALTAKFTLSRPALVTFKLQVRTGKGIKPVTTCPKSSASKTILKYKDVATLVTKPTTPKTKYQSAGKRTKKLVLSSKLPTGRYRLAIRATATDGTLIKSYDAIFWIVKAAKK